MSKSPPLNTSIVKCVQLVQLGFALFYFSQSKRRGSKISNGKEVSKILVDFSTLMFMKLHTSICCRRLFAKVAFGHKQGYMVEKPKIIHRSPFVFLTHLEGAINKLQLIN
jgi:hypothetical protein